MLTAPFGRDVSFEILACAGMTARLAFYAECHARAERAEAHATCFEPAFKLSPSST